MTLRDPSLLTAVVLAPEPAQRSIADGLLSLGVRVAASAADGDAAWAALRREAPDVWVADAALLTRALCERSRTLDAPPALLVVDAGGRWTPGEAEALAAHAGAAGFWPPAALSGTPAAAAIRAEALTRVREVVFQHHAGLPTPAAPADVYARRLAVPDGQTLRFVPVGTLTHITAAGSGTLLHIDGEALASRDTLADLERRLDPAHFCRIHRSTIVRLAAVEALKTQAGGDYEVHLACGAWLSLARGRRDTFVERLALG